ncbi:hypothetical protein OE766_03325 [Pararhizobium sp. YC-54]|uniref:hypothetical protein n=1 Tax=Pararhizobium sp. YC-54 TaxID=2986920 RepID=UPI0021F7E16F|nr:hypothetical protein [Pararhizobium sp. YC-54]MCV9997274.1 hypothetical protein [Pararhizobium sp. YC-54]
MSDLGLGDATGGWACCYGLVVIDALLGLPVHEASNFVAQRKKAGSGDNGTGQQGLDLGTGIGD